MPPRSRPAGLKRERDCDGQPRSKKKAKSSSSSAQPAPEHRLIQGSADKSSAEQPAEQDRLRVAYIYCPRRSWNHAPNVVSEAIENAMDVGSTIINLVFDHDEDAAFLQLEDRWGKMFEVESLGSVLSLYASDSWQLLTKQNTDPVGMAPCLMLTFNSPAFPNYKVCVVTVAFPALPTTERGRIVDASVEEAINSSSDAVVIGGFFHSPFLWLDNRVWKLKLDIDISIISDLYVLPWCATGTLNCTALDAQGPFTLVIDHVQSSAERPASSSPSSVHHDPASSAVLPASEAATSPSRPRSSDRKRRRSHPTAGRICICDWSIEDVGKWLRRHGSREAQSKAESCLINGATLMFLDEEGLIELGVRCKTRRTEILRLLKEEIDKMESDGICDGLLRNN